MSDTQVEGGGLVLQASGSDYKRDYHWTYKAPDYSQSCIATNLVGDVSAMAHANWYSNISVNIDSGRHIRVDRVVANNNDLSLLTNNNFNFEIKSFFNNFDDILSKTNIALCRSGAGTIDDLINYKIPAIILPLPSSKNNHQFENAKILSEIGCAIIADKDLKELDKILLFIRNVIDDKSFNKSLLDKYSKIKRYNTNLLMWNHIQDDQ